MRSLLLALCLSFPLALPAVAQTPEREPPRDLVVPEGAEGLTPDEIYEVGKWLREAGDRRGAIWLRAAADMGDGDAARDIALGAYRGRASNWAADTFRYARIATAEPDGLSRTYYLLAESGRALEPPASSAQIDIWYRLSILHETTNLAFEARHLRQAFDVLRLIVADNRPFPVRYDALLAEEMARRRSRNPGPYIVAAERACANELEDSDRLCLVYRVEAGKRGHAPSRRSVAANILDEGERLSDPIKDRRLAAKFLCRNAIEGDEPALERVARLVVETNEDLKIPLSAVAYLLDISDGLPAAVRSELLAGVVAEFDEVDSVAYDMFLSGDESHVRTSPHCLYYID